MTKNLIPQIAKMLGVKLGEEFKIKGNNELTYRFTSDELKLTYANNIEMSTLATNKALVALLKGKDKIIKKPWEPKEGESFYTFTSAYGEWSVSLDMWTEDPCNYALLDKGWVYRTCEEAKAALPAVLKELSERNKL